MITRRRIITTGVTVLLLAVVATAAWAGLPENAKRQGLQKKQTNGLYRPFLINNVFNYYSNNGDGSFNKFKSDNEGFEFPKGANTTTLFEDGVVWGGKTKGIDHPMVGGSVYKHGIQAGKLISKGGNADTLLPTGDDPGLPKYRVYRVRPDINPTTALDDIMKTKIQNEELQYIIRFEAYTVDDIYNQYVTDWNEWPATDGAPYTDVNHDGIYEPAVDIPGVPGADQTLWYVGNDGDPATTSSLAGCNPIGFEMQRTIWGYKRQGPLGNVIFASTKLINWSGADVDSMFLVQWSDPDNGNATDDFAGCDTARSFGFDYNGATIDKEYGLRTPCVGFTFFQGPKVPGAPTDSGIFGLKYRKGIKNLKMSAFNFFVNGNATYTDPEQGTLTGAEQWYNLMNGLVGPSGSPYYDNKGNLTKFTLAGDPVTGQGWLDGAIAPPGDRRICLVSGPFTFANNDTQEVVVASLAGQGGDRISSVAVARYVSDQAQAAYNLLFDLPVPAPQPEVTIRQLDGEILLTWADTTKARIIENWTTKVGHAFEGYNVYQLPGPSFDPTTAKLLATYDKVDLITLINDYTYDDASGTVLLKPVQHGGDNGIARFYDTKVDAINSRPIVNGTHYYFTVTTYTYSADPAAKPNNLESAPVILDIVPQAALPGNKYSATQNAAIQFTHAAGISTAIPQVNVVDPTLLLPHDYEIQIVVNDSVPSPNDPTVNVANPKWSLYDVTAGATITKPSTTYMDWDKSLPVITGFQTTINGAPFYVAGKELGSMTTTGTWGLSEVNGGGDVTSGGGIFVGNTFINGLLNRDQVVSDVELVVDSLNGQNAYCFTRGGPGAGAGSGGAVYTGFFPQPFSVFELNPDGTHKRQIDFVFMELQGSPVQDHIWAPGSGGIGEREYCFFVAETYTPTAKSKYVASSTTNMSATLGQDDVVWNAWLDRTGDAAYKQGTTWTLKATKIITSTDKWSFSMTPIVPVIGSKDLAKTEAAKINVFPNPYFAFNSQETDKYNHFVTFNHLPTKATIRIFNLAGVLVRTLVKNDASTTLVQWNLNNDSQIPVAAGMYIAYIDMPDVGTTKTLKFAIIPGAQYLDRY